MNRDIFIVTKYYDNGEPWGDHIHYEEPVAAFKNLQNATEYCSSRGDEQELSKYDEHIQEYQVFGSDEDMQCSYDQSFELLKIYRICLFADFTIDKEREHSMGYLVGELPGGKIYGRTKGTPDEVAWVLDKIKREDLKQECVCSINFGYTEDVSKDIINNIINTERYINQVIENKRGGN